MAMKVGRCEDHQPKAWVSSEGKTASQRGYGAKWRKVRKQALSRDNHLCRECYKNGILTPASEVDHILNKASGGTDELSNLQSICNSCHKRKTSQER
jgi:5-methylcytosine-specific restriction protein A